MDPVCASEDRHAEHLAHKLGRQRRRRRQEEQEQGAAQRQRRQSRWRCLLQGDPACDATAEATPQLPQEAPPASAHLCHVEGVVRGAGHHQQRGAVGGRGHARQAQHLAGVGGWDLQFCGLESRNKAQGMHSCCRSAGSKPSRGRTASINRLLTVSSSSSNFMAGFVMLCLVGWPCGRGVRSMAAISAGRAASGAGGRGRRRQLPTRAGGSACCSSRTQGQLRTDGSPFETMTGKLHWPLGGHSLGGSLWRPDVAAVVA